MHAHVFCGPEEQPRHDGRANDKERDGAHLLAARVS